MEVSQYDPKHRRHIEGWNIICFDGEDRIGLTAREWNEIAADFFLTECTPKRRKAIKEE